MDERRAAKLAVRWSRAFFDERGHVGIGAGGRRGAADHASLLRQRGGREAVDE
jgi:hypothetical protein